MLFESEHCKNKQDKECISLLIIFCFHCFLPDTQEKLFGLDPI